MPSSNSSLSFDEQLAAAVVQSATATTHWEQEALVAAMAAARKPLVDAQAREHATTITWEKLKTIAHHLEQ
jgi:hypothetical protein